MRDLFSQCTYVRTLRNVNLRSPSLCLCRYTHAHHVPYDARTSPEIWKMFSSTAL